MSGYKCFDKSYYYCSECLIQAAAMGSNYSHLHASIIIIVYGFIISTNGCYYYSIGVLIHSLSSRCYAFLKTSKCVSGVSPVHSPCYSTFIEFLSELSIFSNDLTFQMLSKLRSLHTLTPIGLRRIFSLSYNKLTQCS